MAVYSLVRADRSQRQTCYRAQFNTRSPGASARYTRSCGSDADDSHAEEEICLVHFGPTCPSLRSILWMSTEETNHESSDSNAAREVFRALGCGGNRLAGYEVCVWSRESLPLGGDGLSDELPFRFSALEQGCRAGGEALGQAFSHVRDTVLGAR